ncbi:EamA family transporter RarD [Sphingomonas sp.]|uniref:EamA family transporter RarD n=1 Tax=Sphingomonas sp. TaxID=28214 RepID=UPI0025D7E13E|nr:EamA family transporter RarD [Sphingomonas sp.]
MQTGLLRAIAAYAIWGLLPLYFLPLRAVDPGEVVAARILGSVVLLLGLGVALGRTGRLRAALTTPRVLAALTASALLISINWLGYIWAVQHRHVLEASLGYFLNPLVSMVLGVAFLGERLTRLQLAAVALAVAGVAVLASGAALAGLWISLTLAISFGLYGLVRKLTPVDALEGLAVETLLLAPASAGYIWWLAQGDRLSFGSGGVVTGFLLAGGVVTAIPLLLFAAAARVLRLTTMGVLQYLAPSLQFAVAVLLLGERLTLAHLICFSLIWAGLALYVVSATRRAA